MISSGRVEMIKHVTFRTDRRAFHLHARAARDKEKNFIRTVELVGKVNDPIVEISQLTQTIRDDRLAFGACEKGGEQLLTRRNIRQRNATRIRLNLHPLNMQR